MCKKIVRIVIYIIMLLFTCFSAAICNSINEEPSTYFKLLISSSAGSLTFESGLKDCVRAICKSSVFMSVCVCLFCEL